MTLTTKWVTGSIVFAPEQTLAVVCCLGILSLAAGIHFYHKRDKKTKYKVFTGVFGLIAITLFVFSIWRSGYNYGIPRTSNVVRSSISIPVNKVVRVYAKNDEDAESVKIMISITGTKKHIASVLGNIYPELILVYAASMVEKQKQTLEESGESGTKAYPWDYKKEAPSFEILY